MTENEISKLVFETGLKVHRKLGIGLYESVYEACLVYELKEQGLQVEMQKDVAIENEKLVIPNEIFQTKYNCHLLEQCKIEFEKDYLKIQKETTEIMDGEKNSTIERAIEKEFKIFLQSKNILEQEKNREGQGSLMG